VRPGDTQGWPLGVPSSADHRLPLRLEVAQCCLCRHEMADPIAVGEDFEYRSSPDTFLAVRCSECGLVYLNPRPSITELGRIYPAEYHAFDFSASRYGFIYQIRRRLEARRVLAWCSGLGPDARILDVGCGDGFHLRILRDLGGPTWKLEGVEPDARGAEAARGAGLLVHQGTLQELALPESQYDLVLVIATLEHVDDPVALLASVRSVLRPGGKIVIVTDSTRTLDFRLFCHRHWGGYHFPRHWNLFDRNTLELLARRSRLEVDEISTLISPVNWVYSLRNILVDWEAPRWLIERFSLRAPAGLAVFTLVDGLHQLFGRGALLRATLKRPI
jgi:SAM-dependent methyltransferase